MFSHFLPMWSPTRGRGRYAEQQAICGTWANVDTGHSVNPSCPICIHLLEEDDAEAKRVAAQWAREDAARCLR